MLQDCHASVRAAATVERQRVVCAWRRHARDRDRKGKVMHENIMVQCTHRRRSSGDDSCYYRDSKAASIPRRDAKRSDLKPVRRELFPAQRGLRVCSSPRCSAAGWVLTWQARGTVQDCFAAPPPRVVRPGSALAIEMRLQRENPVYAPQLISCLTPSNFLDRNHLCFQKYFLQRNTHNFLLDAKEECWAGGCLSARACVRDLRTSESGLEVQICRRCRERCRR